MKLPLIKGTRVDGDAEWRDALPFNMVGFFQSVGSWTGYLRTADGISQFAEGVGIDRGGLWSDRFRKHMRVSGNKLIQVGQFGEVAEIAGTDIDGPGQVVMDNSFNSIAIVAGGKYYRYDGDATVADVTKPVGAGDFIDLCWIDGYYIFTDGENLWNTTLSGSGETTFGGNQRAGSDFAPDEIVGIEKSTDNKLIVFNRYTTERFYNNAGAQFPFARIPNAAIPIGIVGTHAKASIGDGQFIVFGGGKEYSPSFYLLTNSYQNISTKEIDSVIDEYSDFELSGIQIEYRDTRDQGLAICHLPRHTLVYDISLSRKLSENIWYQWGSDGLPWRVVNGVYDPRNIDDKASGWIYGDKQDGRIGKLEQSACTQYGQVVEWACNTPIVRAGTTISTAELVTAPGHSDVENDVVFVSTTKDGVLFGPEVLMYRGNRGDYQKRIIARRLGNYPRWFGMRVRGKSAGVFSITGVEIDATR